MRKWTVAFVLVTISALLNAAPSAKGPAAGSLTNVSVIHASAAPATSDLASEKLLPQLSPDDVPAFNEAADGTKFILLRFQNDGSGAIRAHLRSVRLSAGMSLFIYGVDASGAATMVHGPYQGAGPMQSGDFWSPAISGDQVVVEFQVTGDTPPDLPFEVDRLAGADSSLVTDQPDVANPNAADEVRTSLYRGIPLTHVVRDGLAVFENDIVLGRADDLQPAEAASSKGKTHEGVGVSMAQTRWPGNVMPYVIDSGMTSVYRVTDAIQAWNNALNGIVQLVPRTTEANYVVFVRTANASQCMSPVGYLGFGPQYTYLGDSCATGNAIHEIGHELGLWHEHTRSDRDSYVSIQYQNIDPNAYYNFSKNSWNSMDIGAYDFNSIMHYAPYSFSINGQPAIVTIPAGIPIGQRDGLSSGDIAAVARMYGGSAPAPTPQTVSITINGNPSGAQVVVDGYAVNTPYNTQWVAGSTHTISAGNQDPGNGAQYTFSYWSDWGAPTHTVTASTSNAVFTANFSVAYYVTTSVSGSGSVSTNPSGSLFASGSVVTLTATPASGYCFSSWSGLLSGTPAQTSLTITKSYNVTANFTSCAAPAPTTTTVNSAFTPIRVNAGGAAVWDSNGQLWSGDYGATGGSTYGSAQYIANTSVPQLYTSERYATGPLTYSFNVPNGTYTITLKFAEIYFWTAGQRVFNIAINGQTVAWNFDPAAAAGGANIAVDRTFTTTVGNGNITISLSPVVENPKISAIEIK